MELIVWYVQVILGVVGNLYENVMAPSLVKLYIFQTFYEHIKLIQIAALGSVHISAAAFHIN